MLYNNGKCPSCGYCSSCGRQGVPNNQINVPYSAPGWSTGISNGGVIAAGQQAIANNAAGQTTPPSPTEDKG